MYQDLESNPIQAVRGIYDAIGEELTPEAEAKMQQHLVKNPKGLNGVHRYSMPKIDHRLQNDSETFRMYQQEFNIPEEPAAN